VRRVAWLVLALADASALAWGRHVAVHGRVVDPVGGRTTGAYGRSMLAGGMLRTAVRRGDRDLRALAERTLVQASYSRSAFSELAVAEALAEVGRLEDPALDRTVRKELLAYDVATVGSRAEGCARRPTCWNNLKLVDAVAVLRVLAVPGLDGLPASKRLADRRRARAEAVDVLVRRVAQVQRVSAHLSLPGAPRAFGAVLSDPPPNPVAYHALSTFMLARGMQALPAAERGPRLRASLRRALVALHGLTGPDGDVSWMGRGQGQSWTLALGAAACAMALELLGPQEPQAGRCLGMAARQLAELERRARPGTGAVGIAVLPRPSWVRGVDRYVNRVDYEGLTLFGLQALADALARLGAGPTPLEPAGARAGLRFADPGASGLATTVRDGVWLGVHAAGSHPHDARYGGGLLAVKARGSDGRWRDVLDLRPKTNPPGGPPALGPSLVVRGGLAPFVGTGIRVPRSGVVEVRGAWRRAGRHVRRGVLTYVVAGGGTAVDLRFAAGRDERFVLREVVAPGAPVPTALRQGGRALPRTGKVSRVRRPWGAADRDDSDVLTSAFKVRRAGAVTIRWAVRPSGASAAPSL
jgi:hypothetical protein